ncbi:MAG: site-specific DNA-methyltransferase, partial [Propionibacteriaceae bacterium]|nr:site-specific DNA-methyltransferase [Propionibacteriaceae bacterium]
MPDPYYQDDHVTIYHGDCLEILPTIKFGVLATDPPYGLMSVSDDDGFGRRQNHPDRHRTIAGDTSGDIRDAVLSATGVPALVFHTPRLPEPPGCWSFRLVWDKGRPGMNGGPWRYTHELIFVRGEWVKLGASSFSILRVPPVSSPVHPNEKPAKLLRTLLLHSPPGVILDPFAGSGTTLRAAKDLGRKAIGIELEERYCEIAAERCAQEVLDFGD